MKISFKKTPRPTGLAGVGWGWRIDIKVNKKEVGDLYIKSAPLHDDKVHIMIAFKDANEGCGWKWKFWSFTPKEVSRHSKDAQEMGKTAVKKLLENIKEEELHFFER